MAKPDIQITILDDSNRRDCYACVEIDWSSPDSISLAHQRIKERFGKEIPLDYLDLAQGTTDHQAWQWSQIIKNKSLSVPLLLINGELRIAGQFGFRQLLDAIETEIEIGAHR